MNQRRVHRFCMALVAFSVLLRAMCAAGWDAAAGQALKNRGLSLPFAASAQDEPQAQHVWVVQLANAAEQEQVEYEPQAVQEQHTEETERPPQEQSVQLSFTQQEAECITIGGSCSYEVDRTALLQRPSTLKAAQDGPSVLIVHTHSTEAYSPEAGWEYTPSDTLRTTDETRCVIRVGDELAAVLNENGIETLHDTALNDYPNYTGAYDRMQETISQYLAQYPSIQMVIDVHRDAAEDRAGLPVSFTADVDGEPCAQLMLVVGTDEGGLEHPDWQENLANALKLQALLNRSAPGLCRDLDLRTERFNQNLTPGSVLCEFGATGNTLQQALRSARIFGAAVAELLTKTG